VGCAGGRSDGRRANEGGAPERFNFVSDELLISASAMCLAPLSPMLLSRRGGRDAGENEHRRSEWDAREDGAMGGERMRVAHRRGTTSFSDELLISASAMCLAPLSPMLLSRRGGRDAGENEHRRSEWDAREDGAMGGERMRVAHSRGSTSSATSCSSARRRCAWPRCHRCCCLEEEEEMRARMSTGDRSGMRGRTERWEESE
jgi:hypothetical protein